MSHLEKANRYVDDVIAGRVAACKWVMAACQRQKRDLKRIGKKDWPYVFDVNKAERVCRFVESLKHIKGPKAGTLIELEGWQCFIIATVYGWVHKDGPRKGKRRFRRAYLEMPRGNAKSTLSSAIGLYMLAADGEGGAEVYSAATTRDQARIVFKDAQIMARNAPELCKALGVEVIAHNIHVMRTSSKFEALSAEGSSLDGLNIHFAAIDELHAHKRRDVYDVIETAMGKRDQSLLWVITTAGSNRAGICYEVRTYLTKVLDGQADDDSVFGIIYTIDDGDDWTLESTWEKANPNWGISVMPDIIGQLARKAMQMPSAQNNFLTKHLNVWVNADTAWMDMRAWDACANRAMTLEDFEGEPCYVGIDLASKIDIAAVAILFVKDEKYHLFGRYYLPEETALEATNSQYAGWEIEGRLILTPGNVIDFAYIEQDLKELASRFEVREVPYDPFQATQFATRMMAEGFPMVEMRPTVLNFSEPMKQLEALVRSGKLVHDGDPVMGWMVSNVVCHLDAKDNIYPRKERPENKIDGVIASIMTIGRAMVNGGNGASVYEERGILTL